MAEITKLCRFCGKEQPELPPDKKCPSCQSVVFSDEGFCRSCGSKVG